MGKGVKCCLYLKVDNVGKQALRDAICAMNRGEERRDSFEAERGEQWGEQCGWMGAKRWQIGGILYTDNVRERLSYHLRHNRQWESITLSLLVCCLRTCFPC